MPFPPGKHAHITLGGSIGTETWSIGHWKEDQGSGIPTPTQLNTYAAAVLAAFNTQFWNAATLPFKNYASADTSLINCSVHYYSGGVLIGLGTATITPVAGAGASDPHPAYVAWVITTLSDFPGRSKRGRLYLPATAVSISGSTSQVGLATTDQDTQLAHFKAYLQDSTTNVPAWDPGVGMVNEILSQHLGSVVEMTSLRMDSLPDTQHGRSRKLVANHVSAVAL